MMLKQLPGLLGRANRTVGFRSLVASSGGSLQFSGVSCMNKSVSTTIPTTVGTKLGAMYQSIGTSVGQGMRKYTSGSVRSGPNSLQVALSNELMEETANDEVDSELEVMQKDIEKHFTIEETLGNGVVTLKRKYNNEEIVVTFDCQDENEESALNDDFDVDKYYNEDNVEGDDEDDEFPDEDLKYGINFTVTIKKKNSEMIAHCVADSTINVVSLKVSPVGDENDEQRYKGPPFENLSQAMQNALTNFLEDRKVDANLSSFILLYSQYKEQKEYVQWLKSLAEFTA